MRYYELKEIAEYLKRYGRIRSAGRIGDNVLRLEFDGGSAVGFDLSRGRTEIFKADGKKPQRDYHAPFDTVLKRRFSGAKLLDASVADEDKILRIEAAIEGAYKAQRSTLQLEFTGRHTNAIVLDENGVVLEALRHVDSDASYRVVQPGVRLLPLKPYKGERKSGRIEDVEIYLAQKGIQREKRRIAELKALHAKTLKKRMERLEKELRSLPEKEVLKKRAEKFSRYADIVMAHLHEIKPYDRRLETLDFDGNPVVIDLPALPNPGRMGEHFYALAKRAANKAARLYIEEQNLKSRIEFYGNMLKNLEAAESEEEILLLFPPKRKRKKREAKSQCELFEIGDYRVLVGRNERENVWVLKNAKSGDIWMHLKDRPSSHCIVQTGGRRQVPRDVIERAAKICVETSASQPGDYPVDFTHRRNVKIERGAHVTYVNYDTIIVRKGR